MKVFKLKSPAKLNFRLDVLGKRNDGYHDLRMINSAINLYDEIDCTLIEKGIIVECENDTSVPEGEANIVYGVAKEILAYSNKNIGVKIKPNIVTPIIPENTAIPMACLISAPGPVANARGDTPMIKASDVMRMGRKRNLEA